MLVKKAEQLARALHRDQVDKAGEPYVEHLQAVVNNLHNPTDEMIAVAWLHDSVEDTSITLNHIASEFGQVISDAVEAISKRSGENYQDYLCRVKQSPIARWVKIADLTHNADLTRLVQITEKDIARRNKYLMAMDFLLAED